MEAEALLEKFFEIIDERIEIMAPKLNLTQEQLRNQVYQLLGYQIIRNGDNSHLN